MLQSLNNNLLNLLELSKKPNHPDEKHQCHLLFKDKNDGKLSNTWRLSWPWMDAKHE